VTTVVVRLPNHVGDACMALPAIRALLAAGWPLTLAGRAWGESLFAGLRLPYTALEGRVLSDRRRLRALRASLGDVCGLVLPNSFGSALSFFLAGIPAAGLAADGRRTLLKWAVADPGPRHEVERFHAAARGALLAWGSPEPAAIPTELGLPVTAVQRREAQQALREQGVDGSYALLAPVAAGRHRGQAKHWAHFAELLPVLGARGLQAIAAPPPAEAAAVRAALPTATLLRPLPPGSFAALAAGAAVVIANDSGTSHIAAAVAARQVTIFGVTDRARTGPWSKRAVCVGANGAWPSVDEVVAAIDQALAAP
jgi:heptosyltransferase-2